MTPAPGRVLRLAVAGWGLGDLAMGRTLAGAAWLVAEGVGLVAVAGTVVLFADTSWYLLPFLLGVSFIVAWAAQAVLAYRRARRLEGATPPAATRSPAATIAWLTLPLLLWGTGFWLVAAGAATPAAVVDEFVSRWPEAGGADRYRPLADDPDALHAAAQSALERLRGLCRQGRLSADCAVADANLLRDVRVSIREAGDGADGGGDVGGPGAGAVAVAEVVRYEHRPATFLGIFRTSELVPVSTRTVLALRLEPADAPLGAVRWRIVDASGG